MTGDGYDWAGTPETLEDVRQGLVASVSFEIGPTQAAKILEAQRGEEIQ